MSAAQVFTLAATWDPVSKNGTLENSDGSLRISHAGVAAIDGKAGAPNPEELLLAAVAACFVQTWALFLTKLAVPIARPVLNASCEMDKDPAGGFRVTKMDVAPHVPKDLWEARRADRGASVWDRASAASTAGSARTPWRGAARPSSLPAS